MNLFHKVLYLNVIKEIRGLHGKPNKLDAMVTRDLPELTVISTTKLVNDTFLLGLSASQMCPRKQLGKQGLSLVLRGTEALQS